MTVSIFHPAAPSENNDLPVLTDWEQDLLDNYVDTPIVDVTADHNIAMDVAENNPLPAAPRYIAYVSTGLPGDVSPGMFPVASVRDAVDYLRGYAERTAYLNGVNPSVSLYVCLGDADMWEEANDFSDVGCPFNYPSYILSVGPRGGIKTERV